MTREEIEKDRQYQLTGAAIDYCRKEYPHYDGEMLGEIVDAFESGAEWEHKRLVEKAKEWLENTLYIHTEIENDRDFNEICRTDWVTSGYDSVEDFINSFCKYMEE